MDDRTRLPFGVLATAATIASLVSCYATRIEIWIPSLHDPIKEWVNIHVQAAIIVATAAAAVVGLLLDRKHHGSITPFAVGCAGFVLIAWSMYAPFGRIEDIVGFVLLVSAVFLNQTRALRALTLNLKSQNTEIERQHRLLEQQSAQLANWNRTLSQRVEDQLSRIERLGRLKRFFSPQLADLILDGDTQDPLQIHRREIAVVFLDLRGFTGFADRAEPEEVIDVLQEYHTAMGELIGEYQGTLERFTGDGIMFFFGDPITIVDPVQRAVRLSLAMRDRVETLTPRWSRRGYDLGLGIGVAFGYATIGAIGFEGRWDYAAIGRVTNLAARLCAEAQPGQILINQSSLDGVESLLDIEAIGDLTLKGFQRPVRVVNIVGLKPARLAHSSRRTPDGQPSRYGAHVLSAINNHADVQRDDLLLTCPHSGQALSFQSMTPDVFDPHFTAPTKYCHELPDGRVQCDLCPRLCKLHDGQRGLCFVRANQNGRVVLTSYGRSSGYCIDPIEKKPLNHYLPGTPILSFGTAGCNLSCRFCQNWDISKSREWDTLSDAAAPEMIARVARRLGCRSVAYTYNDPAIFMEYAMDVAQACRVQGIKSVAVTAGYMTPEPRREFYKYMDAVNVDLKAFTEDFYHRICGGHLQPVLDTLIYIKQETRVWLEITTLLIPGHNDSGKEIDQMTGWGVANLGPDVPWHFTAFHPDWKMLDVRSTPASTLARARKIAMANGVRYAYTGNVHDEEGASTYCHRCGATLIGRDWYEITAWNLDENGRCGQCGTACAGVFEARPGTWGARRQPVRLESFAYPREAKLR